MIKRISENNSTDKYELQMLHSNADEYFTQAYKSISEMIVYCQDSEVEAYEDIAQKLLDLKYKLRELGRNI